MADLDDLFKKRDKKKKQTTKTKFSTLNTEEFAKQLEATSSVLDAGGESELQQPFDAANQIDGTSNTITLTAVTNQVSSSSGGGGSGGGSGGGGGGPDNLDEEWKPFDSDENKDYSGLRINQNWKLEDEEDLNEDGDNDDGEKKVRPFLFRK